MDVITLALLNKLKKSGSVGYSEKKVILKAELVDSQYLEQGKLIGLEVGKTYTVVVDSGKYEAVCKKIDGTTYLGNLYIVDPEVAEDTGECFFVGDLVTEEDRDGFCAFVTDGSTSISIETETIHPIDQKYLPGVCLPVVEIATQPTDEGAPLTAEESAKMDEVAAMGLPIVCRAKIDDEASITAVLFIIKSETGTAYSCVLEGASQLSILTINDSWRIVLAGGGE